MKSKITHPNTSANQLLSYEKCLAELFWYIKMWWFWNHWSSLW